MLQRTSLQGKRKYTSWNKNPREATEDVKSSVRWGNKSIYEDSKVERGKKHRKMSEWEITLEERQKETDRKLSGWVCVLEMLRLDDCLEMLTRDVTWRSSGKKNVLR